MKKHLHTQADLRVFVFGSNLLGIHGAGAAQYAQEKLGAKFGVGRGITGRSYALPTCQAPGMSLPLHEVAAHIAEFIDFAKRNRSLQFLVSEVGCGIAGFRPEVIAPYFAEAPSNCDLPPGWRNQSGKPPAKGRPPNGGRP